jgi:hypothetical protein
MRQGNVLSVLAFSVFFFSFHSFIEFLNVSILDKQLVCAVFEKEKKEKKKE